MSPEQAEINQLDIDTRSDVYSLGVLLYELLTGTTPLQHRRLGNAALLEVLRLIREQEPPKPSTRLGTTEELPAIAANRNIEPRRLTGLVRGELDWIVMKALEKDRNRRYESANTFAGDVRRYLDDEQVSACPPSTWHRLRKLVRRHKGEVLAASLLALTLVGGIIGTTWGLIRATEAQAEAVREANQKEDALQEKVVALTAARQSKRDADEKLFASYVDQSRAIRTSRRPGQRFQSLAVLRRAADLARILGLPDERFHDLRNAAVAAMAMPDLSPVGPRHPWPNDAHGVDVDDSEVLYVRTDRQGNCSVRRVADDAELYRLPGLGKLAGPQLSRDGKYLAVSHFVNGPPQQPFSVQLWELGTTAARLIRSEDEAHGFAFRVEPPQVALTYTDGAIGLFELPSGRQVSRLPPVAFTREVQIALHPTEPVVAVGSYFESSVQLRDLASGEVLAALPQERRPTGLAWQPNGRSLAIGYEKGPIRLCDPATLEPVRTLETLQTITGMAFNPAGDRLAATGWGGGVALFDVGTGQNLFSSRLSPRMLRFSSDGRRLAAALEDGRLVSWQLGDGREFRTLVRKSIPMKTGVATWQTVSPHGRLVAAAMTDGIGLWDLAGGGELVFIPMGEEGFHNLVLFEPSGALLTLGPTGLSRWPVEAAPSAPGRLIIGPPERVSLPPGSAVGQSSDGRVTVVCSRVVAGEQFSAGGWILHANRSDRPIHLDHGADIEWIAVSPDGRWVVTVDHSSGASKIWDARDGRLVKTLAEWGAGFPQFSPDGRWLSTDLDGGRLVSVGTWEPGPRIGGAGTFSPDGTLVAVPSGHLIRLVEPATGRELAVLEDPNLETAYLPIFTPDGANLIVSSAVSVVHVWDLRLIRQNLAEMGLDWDAPPYPPANAARTVAPPLSVEVRLGDSVRPALTHEEQARKVIDRYRHALEHDPDRAETCNNLAWSYLTGPESLRDVEAAVPLAEKAVRLDPASSIYGNTLGVAYYRAGRYREAVEILRANIERQEDWALAFDLYFLAMSHHRLGEPERARDYFDWAGRWTGVNKGLSPGHLEELHVFRNQASELLGVAVKDRVEIDLPKQESEK